MGDEGNEEDLALMAKVARGDEDAFAKIVAKHQHAVLGTVAKMTNQSPDTEDITQQVFIRLWIILKAWRRCLILSGSGKELEKVM
mgnify:CR=1 FL=1